VIDIESSEIMVSIICITYNHEKYIRDALEGFINQKTNFRFEVVIHDDASTDGTAKIIKEYEQKYPDIIRPIYQTENRYSQGKNVMRYTVPFARGKYIATCEGDDYWTDTNKLQKQVDFLENNLDYVACIHNTKIEDYINPNGQERYINSSKDAYDVTFYDVVRNGSGTVYQWSSLIYRRQYFLIAYSDLRPAYFNKAKGFGDWVLIIYLSLEGKIKYMPDVMSNYRFGVEGSYTLRNISREKQIEQSTILIEFLNAVDEYTNFQYSDVIQSAQRFYEFHRALSMKDYSVARKKDYKELWLAINWKGRLIFFIECKLPRIYKIYRKIKD